MLWGLISSDKSNKQVFYGNKWRKKQRLIPSTEHINYLSSWSWYQGDPGYDGAEGEEGRPGFYGEDGEPGGQGEAGVLTQRWCRCSFIWLSHK